MTNQNNEIKSRNFDIRCAHLLSTCRCRAKAVVPNIILIPCLRNRIHFYAFAFLDIISTFPEAFFYFIFTGGSGLPYFLHVCHVLLKLQLQCPDNMENVDSWHFVEQQNKYTIQEVYRPRMSIIWNARTIHIQQMNRCSRLPANL